MLKKGFDPNKIKKKTAAVRISNYEYRIGNLQALKYLKIGTRPASQKLLACMEKC